MPSHNQGYPITIDGVASSTIPEYICHKIKRQLVGRRRHTTVPVPGFEGGWLFPERAGFRQITLESSVLADSFPSGRRSAVRAIAAWADQHEWVKLICGDDPDYFNLVILDDTPDVDEWREVGSFDLVFLAQPYAISTAIQTDQHVAASDSDTFSVDNDGDARTYPIITLTPDSSATSTTISVGDRDMTYTTTVTNAGKLTINGLARVVHTGVNVDTDVIGDFTGASISMGGLTVAQFPWLDPGSNQIDINMVGSGGWTADVVWRERTR